MLIQFVRGTKPFGTFQTAKRVLVKTGLAELFAETQLLKIYLGLLRVETPVCFMHTKSCPWASPDMADRLNPSGD